VRYLARAGEQDRLAQQLCDLAQTTSAACPIPYAALRTARDGFGRIVSALSPHDGDPQDLPDAIRARLETIEREWEGFGTALDAYLHTQSAVEAALGSARLINNTLPRLMERLDEVVEVLVRNRQDRHQIHLSARQLKLAQRITTHLQGLLAGRVPRAGTMDQFGRDVALYGQVLKGLSQGSAGLGFEPIRDLEARPGRGCGNQRPST
jgi:twitching motility protein PilJ